MCSFTGFMQSAAVPLHAAPAQGCMQPLSVAYAWLHEPTLQCLACNRQDKYDMNQEAYMQQRIV